jgi:intron-binding protein aquarius
VALFMYMRLIGYPSEKISILTTYNGQKHLIRDVLRKRCANSDWMGQPDKITTVDKFQGQQNDFIILSLVRTRNVGHLRDVRRLVVALSRARLGLYIFGRVSLFRSCFELTPAFSILLARGTTQLQLVMDESFPPKRAVHFK